MSRNAYAVTMMGTMKIVIVLLTRVELLIAADFNRGFVLSVQGYKTLLKIGVYGCARHCGIEPDCRSFSYNKDILRCELTEFDHRQLPTMYMEKSTSIYGDKGSIISNPQLMGNCHNKVCPQYHMCVSLASGTAECIVSACGQPPGIPRTDYKTMPLVPIGETLVYTCSTGYVGSATTTCLPNGEWSDPKNLCIACDQPPSVANTNEYTGSTLIGTTVTYVCDSGYTPSGSVTIECKADATWESTSLVCEPDCENAPSNIDSNPYMSRTYFGASVAYACSTGYTKSSGTGYRPCEANGMWGTLDLVCDPIDCGLPPTVSGFQSISFYSTTYLNTATYTCSPTRTSTNPSQMSIHCQSDGSWSAVQFQCQDNGPGPG